MEKEFNSLFEYANVESVEGPTSTSVCAIRLPKTIVLHVSFIKTPRAPRCFFMSSED